MKTLHYATARGRWRGHALAAVRLAIVAVAFAIAAPLLSGVWARARLLYWQRQCLNYRPDPSGVVFDSRPAMASRLLAAGDAYRRTWGTPPRAVGYANPAWPHLYGLLTGSATGAPEVTLFLGPRDTPAGRRRLVYVGAARVPSPLGAETWQLRWAVLEAGSLSRRPRLLVPLNDGTDGHVQVFAAAPPERLVARADPADRTRVEVRQEEPAVTLRVSLCLTDLDGLTVKSQLQRVPQTKREAVSSPLVLPSE